MIANPWDDEISDFDKTVVADAAIDDDDPNFLALIGRIATLATNKGSVTVGVARSYLKKNPKMSSLLTDVTICRAFLVIAEERNYRIENSQNSFKLIR